MADKAPRRQYVINPGFQMRWSLFIALTGMATAAPFAAMLWVSLDEQNTMIQESIGAEKALYEAHQDAAILLLNLPETSQEEAEAIGTHFDDAYKNYERVSALRRDIARENTTQQLRIVVLVVFIGVALFFVGIILTHTVAGPLYVIHRQLESFAERGKADARPLRRSDEFKEIYDVLQRVLGNPSSSSGL